MRPSDEVASNGVETELGGYLPGGFLLGNRSIDEFVSVVDQRQQRRAVEASKVALTDHQDLPDQGFGAGHFFEIHYPLEAHRRALYFHWLLQAWQNRALPRFYAASGSIE